MEEKISFVIVEFFSVLDIKKCLECIQNKCSDLNFEIIVSSNSLYNEDTQIDLVNELDSAKWVFNEKNGGFGYAMNEGLKNASGDFLIVMNPDVKIIDSIEPMINYIKENTSIGIIAPAIYDDKGNLQDSCRKYLTIQSFIGRQIKRIISKKEVLLTKNFDYSKIQNVDWVIGAFMMVRREAYIKVGGFDDKYFMYAEDMDWSTRIQLSGYEIVYYPNIRIQYKGTRMARYKKKYALIFIKSHLRYWHKFGFIRKHNSKSLKK